MIKKYTIFFFLSIGTCAFSQEFVLDRYIEEGLKENLALRQKEFSCERSMAALKEARGMFLPSLGIEARYTRAGGGRIIDVPIGDLVNPGFKALNTLLQSFGQPAAFPTDLPNEHIPFLREKEQETKLRMIQPVFQPAIYYNYKIRSALRDIESLSRDSYARQLIADIQTAYFNFLKTEQVVTLLSRTDSLVNEQVRVAESLFRNDKATRADVYRAKADLYEFKQVQADAERNRNLAASYFNFLLNRPLDSCIEKPEASLPIREAPWTAEEAESLAVSRREELCQLDRAVDLMGSKVAISRTAFLPGVSAVVDWGYWDETYRFNNSDDFWTASVVASWNLFNGFQDKSKIDQAKLERRERQSELEAVRSRIRIQAHDAWESVRVTEKSLAAARERLTAARKSFELIDRMYREGMAPQIEVLNARNSLTQAEVNAAVCEYDCHIRFAELEKVIAVRTIKLE
jgi:outer membrane protein TolC